MKKIVPVIVLVVVLAGAYKFVLAKPAPAEPKPKIDGTVYVLGKEFLINLADQRYAKVTVALVLSHEDTSTVPAGGHEATKAPEGYGSNEPIATNSTASGRSKNRRVEVVLPRINPVPNP